MTQSSVSPSVSLSRIRFHADPDDPRHGTLNGYSNLKCRCSRCRAANTAYYARRRNTPGVPRKDIAERFWEKVRKTDGCWFWTSTRGENGYGQFTLRTGVVRRAHRIAYELAVGPIPDGLEIDHLCRVRACVNPAHLEPVTRQENIRRAVAAKTHCPKGHPRTPENSAHDHVNGSRVWRCKTCRRIQNAKTNAKWRSIYKARREAEQGQVA